MKSADFMPLISRLLDAKGTTWIVSDNAVRDLALLGIWDLIDSRMIYLSGDPVDVTGRKVCKHEREPAPTVILQDPPVIVSLRRAGSQGVVKWLSLENWGFDSLSQEAPCETRARDIERQLRAINWQLARAGWGGLRPTASAQAAAIWKERYQTHAPFIHANKECLRLESRAIFGGRGECWRIGRVQGPLYQLDVSGMYSHLSGQLSLPVAFHTYHSRIFEGYDTAVQQGQGVLARVKIGTDQPIYPYRRGADVVYPVGRFWTILGGEELEHAANHGCIIDWDDGCTYEMAPFLTAFQKAMRKERERCESYGDHLGEKWTKRMANCIVGRMARRESGWQGYDWLPAPMPWGEYEYPAGDGTTRRVRVIAWHPEIEEPAGFSEDAVPAANVWVTAAGRQMLWRLMQTCGMDNVFYVQTDEIWTNDIGYERLTAAGEIVPGEWGKLALKGIYSWAVFDGINTYRTPDHAVCAGVPGSGGKPLTRGDHYRVIKSPLASVRGCGTPEATEREYVYNPGGVYQHGRILPDGRVEPWQVEE